MATKVQPCLLSARTMREGYMIVRDFIEEVDLLLFQRDRGGNRVDWRITPSLVKETSIMVQRLKIIHVLLRAQPF